MNPQQSQSNPTSALKRRREVLALTCQRCGHEKPVCDGHPCANCGDQGVVCDGKDCGHPRGAFDKGYVEWLENERKILSLGVQEACRRLIEANLWPTESLPRVGRLLSIHDMLVALGLMQDGKDNLRHSEDSGRKKSKSPLAIKQASGKKSPDLNGYRNTFPYGFLDHKILDGESSRPRIANPGHPPFQSTATALASLLDDTSLARHRLPNAAIMIPQESRDFHVGQEGRSWSHTMDAYQQVSGPSNLSTRTSPVFSRSEGIHRQENISRQNSEQKSKIYEATRSGSDETTPGSDEDKSEYIKIPF